jgi:hypothetical protein
MMLFKFFTATDTSKPMIRLANKSANEVLCVLADLRHAFALLQKFKELISMYNHGLGFRLVGGEKWRRSTKHFEQYNTDAPPRYSGCRDVVDNCGTRPISEGKRDETVSTTPRRNARSRDKG